MKQYIDSHSYLEFIWGTTTEHRLVGTRALLLLDLWWFNGDGTVGRFPRIWGLSGKCRMEYVDLRVPATDDNFTEAGYLEANPDVAAAVARTDISSGREHFEKFGRSERRYLATEYDGNRVIEMRESKFELIRDKINFDMRHSMEDGKLNFLSDELRRKHLISDSNRISSNKYDPFICELIKSNSDGLIIDCGAGYRNRYYSNIVNFEIVNYRSTDVLGVGEALPFYDSTFDGVISNAVLEHVRDPFKCASEIIRVLKPGGRLICSVPFLQPLHGYPNHYYNMTGEGLRALFENDLQIDDHIVAQSLLPIWSLTWIVQSWSDGLPQGVKEEFLDTPLREFLRRPSELLDRSYVTQLPVEKNFELASATMIFATKPMQLS